MTWLPFMILSINGFNLMYNLCFFVNDKLLVWSKDAVDQSDGFNMVSVLSTRTPPFC